jgi:hypothetical protein
MQLQHAVRHFVGEGGHKQMRQTLLHALAHVLDDVDRNLVVPARARRRAQAREQRGQQQVTRPGSYLSTDFCKKSGSCN